MYETTIYPARAAVHDLLQGWSWSSEPPTVLWGAPTERDDTAGAMDVVFQGEPTVEAIPFPGLSTRMDEEYTLPVVVDVRQYGDDEQATEAHAWAHVNDVLSMFRQNLTLQGTVNRFTGFAVEPVSAPAPTQWRTQIVVRASVVGIVPAE